MASCLPLSFIGDKRWTMESRLDVLAGHTALASRIRALGHPARLEILRVLAARGICICGEVVDVLPLAQSTVSQHLKVLKEAGFVRGEIDGPKSCYCLDQEVIAQFRGEVDALLTELDNCCPATPKGKAP
jgi:ArsR family transcriptional regulator